MLKIIYTLIIVLLIFTPSTVKYDSCIYSQWEKLHYFYPNMTFSHYEHIYEAANRYKLEIEFIAAIIQSESNYRSRAISSKGARGLMQVMPLHVKQHQIPYLFEDRQNILKGSEILRDYLDKANGNKILALKNYNSGPNSRFFNGPYIIEVLENYKKTNPKGKIIK